jgi:hypothetical protein
MKIIDHSIMSPIALKHDTQFPAWKRAVTMNLCNLHVDAHIWLSEPVGAGGVIYEPPEEYWEASSKLSHISLETPHFTKER